MLDPGVKGLVEPIIIIGEDLDLAIEGDKPVVCPPIMIQFHLFDRPRGEIRELKGQRYARRMFMG